MGGRRASRASWMAAASIAVTLALALEARSDTPLRTLEDCERAAQSSAHDVGAYTCFHEYAQRTGDRQGTQAFLESRIKADPQNPGYRHALGLVLFNADGRRSLVLLEEAAHGYGAQGNRPGEARARTQLAQQLARWMRLDESTRQLDVAEGLIDRRREPFAALRLDQVRGLVAELDGDLSSAWLHYRRIELSPRFSELPPEDGIKLLKRLGWSADMLGRYRLSFDYYQRVTTMAESAGSSRETALGLVGMARAASSLVAEGEFDRERALDIARRGLKYADAEGLSIPRLEALSAMGLLLQGREALAHYDELLTSSRGLDCSYLAVHALISQGLNLVDVDETRGPEALALVEEAMREAAIAADDPSFAVAAAELALMRFRVGQSEQAIAESMAALDTIERLRALQSLDDLRSHFFSAWTRFYYRIIDALLSETRDPQDHLALVYAVGERMRARVLLDHLEESGVLAIDERPATDEALRLLREIAGKQLQLARPQSTAGEHELAAFELERLEHRYDELRQAERFGTAEASREFPELAEMARALRTDEAILSFFLPQRSFDADPWLLVHTRDETRAHRLALDPDLGRRVSLWTGLIENRDDSDSLGVAQIYGSLLQPAIDTLPEGIRRLILVPDGPLHRLPFGALRSGSNGLPLALRFEIVTVPSATFWWEQRRLSPPGVRDLLVLADPLVSPGDAAESGWWRAESLGPLPYARVEARGVLHGFQGAGEARIGLDASESAFLQTELGRFGILHFATHAVVDRDHPDRSAIVLSPGAGEDGLLQVRELRRVDLAGKMITLSACRSAGGPLRSGEGVMSLARGFFQAGARTVVASLWPLRDREAAQVFPRVYEHLAAGESVAGAVMETRRELIERGAPSATWAGLIVLGDGSLVPRGTASGSSLGLLSLLSTVLVVVLAFGGATVWTWLSRAPIRLVPLALAVLVFVSHVSTSTGGYGWLPAAADGYVLALLIGVAWIAALPDLSFRQVGLRWKQASGSVAGSMAAGFSLCASAFAWEAFVANGTSPSTMPLLYQATLPVLAAELTFRGVLPALLDEAFGRGQRARSVVGLGALVAVALPALMQAFAATSSGLAFDAKALIAGTLVASVLLWIRLRTGSLLLPVLFHGLLTVGSRFI